MQLWAQIRSWADAALVVALAALYLTSFELESPINGFVLREGSEDDFEALEVFDQDTRFIIEALVEQKPFPYNPQHHLLYHLLTEALHASLQPWIGRDARSVYAFLEIFTVLTGVGFLWVWIRLLREMGVPQPSRLLLVLLTGVAVSAWFNFSAFEAHSLGMAAIAYYILALYRIARGESLTRGRQALLLLSLVFLFLCRLDTGRFILLTALLLPLPAYRDQARWLAPVLCLALLGGALLYLPLTAAYLDVPWSEVPTLLLSRTERLDLVYRMRSFENLTPGTIAAMATAAGVYSVVMPVGEAAFRTPLSATLGHPLALVTVVSLLALLAGALHRGAMRSATSRPFVMALGLNWVAALLFFTWYNPVEPFLWILEFLPFAMALVALACAGSNRWWPALATTGILVLCHNVVFFLLPHR
jgi:hypothetical protein